MMQILFLRHGTTEWNIQKKLQGRTDISLAATGEAQVLGWVKPKNITDWYVSPLRRAQQTATLLGLIEYQTCADLIEMDWGSWEGKTLDRLRNEAANAMAENEEKGLDMRPPGGESPRQVRGRVHRWVRSLPGQTHVGAITHKGVIRAALSLATDWDMKSPHRVKIRNNAGYLFSWSSGKLNYEKELRLAKNEP